MLRSDDIDRILDAGEEIGIDMDEKGAREMWDKYEKECGHEMELPVSFGDLVDILVKESDVVLG